MKLRKSKAHLILSSVHLGASEDIVKIYANVAGYYDASVYHLGATLTDKESKEYVRLQRSLEVANARADQSEREADILRNETIAAAIESRLKDIQAEESERIQSLTDNFGKMTLVVSRRGCTDHLDTHKSVEIVDDGIELSKYMFLSAVQTTTDRNTNNPISRNARNHLKRHNRYSYVVAHPVPSIQTLPKPGLNEAHSYYTVGSLRHVETPEHFSEFYKVSHMPCAVLVLIDTETGEFHAKQLHIDYLTKKGGMPSSPVVLDGGLVFRPIGKPQEVESDDKATLSTDDHAPHQHPGTLGCLRALNTLHRPGTFINNGDAGEFGSVNRHTKERPGDREGMRLVDDLSSVERLLNAQCNTKSIKRRILVDSNHHEWVTLFVSENPSLKGMTDWETIAKRPSFAGWDVMIRDEGEPRLFYFGDFLIRHGDQENLQNGAEMSDSGKYACGHYHRFNAFQRAVMIGCGRDLGPGFTANQINSWISMTTSLTKCRGITAINPKVVLHDKTRPVSRFAYRNAIYEVDHFKIAM